MRKDATNYYIISDTHFGHDKLINDGIKSKDEDAKVLKSLSVVRENDVLIHLGDVSFYDHQKWHSEFISSVLGKKILILGNHDRQSNTWYYKVGWDFVCNSFNLNIYGYRILFSHRPVSSSILESYNLDINVHGHLHADDHRAMDKTDGNCFLVYNKIINLRKLVGK